MSLLKNKHLWLFITFGIIILVVSLRRPEKKKDELPVLGELIDFRLTDQNGNEFANQDMY